MKTTTKKARRAPFAHAEDLAPAYREFSDAIAALVRLEETGFIGFRAEDAQRVTHISTAIWKTADARVAAWKRIGAAARRVHVAKIGRKDAVRWDGFKPSKAPEAKA
jgi:hypothetical protein